MLVRRLSHLGLTAAAFLLGACGGGGSDSVSDTTLAITSTVVSEAPSGADANSLYESADSVHWEIPLRGGCGGPYVVSVVGGALPPGIAALGGLDPQTQQARHHLSGVLLGDGVYHFRLQVVDTSCSPFADTTADFTWTVARGGVAIVGADPALLPPGTQIVDGVVRNPVYPALPDAVYGTYAVRQLLVAGGTPPYSIELVDDPQNPDDRALPSGVSIPPSSTSLVGSAIEILDGAAFVLTFRAQDSQGQYSAPFTLQWAITAPPIVIADNDMPDGRCGTAYAHQFTIVDGVPPFQFEFVQCDVDRDGFGDPLVTYHANAPPTITPTCATQRVSTYPAPNLLGPDYRSFHVPPEGLYLGDGPAGVWLAQPGFVGGVPRRRGEFRVILHVTSTVVPSARGQHAWKVFEFSIAPSEPPTGATPAFGHNPAYTSSPSFPAAPPFARIADAEVGTGYNPDSASHSAPGLQLRAQGGVRKDGRTDAPHASAVTLIDGTALGEEDGSTPTGGYDWTVDPDPAGDGDVYTTLPPGMTLDGWTGVWRVANPALLVRQGPQGLAFTVTDQQLPLQVRNSSTQKVSFGVGPDKVLYTESTTSGASTSGATWHDMNDGAQTLRVLLPYVGAPTVMRNLDTSDLAATHTIPASTTSLSGTAAPHTLLAAQDYLRVCVNPAGWWDDVHTLHPWGARSGLHADGNAYNNYIWGENDLSSATDYSRQPSITAVDVPPYRAAAFNAVSHAPLSGVYTDGGKLYPFSNNAYFGVLMVRSDASIYVPFAFGKTTTVGGLVFTGFGDGVMNGWAATGRSQLRIPHMAVSPDGRFAAMKIKTSETSFSEGAATTKIVLFSLTGEKPFGGQTWCVVGSGSDGSSSQGVYLYAPSLVLTNTQMYWICGNLNGATSIETPSRQHYIYTFPFAHPGTGAVTAGATGTGTLLTKADGAETAWTNTAGSPMQARYQLYHSPLASGFATAAHMHFDGMNLLENSLCPMPFRVSADGRAVAILAMPDQPVANASSQAFHVWVDFQGAGVRRLSSAPRHITGGGARGYTLARGSSSNTYENWHRYGGPTPHLEISDDGTKVAVVVNRYAGTPTYSSPTTSWVTAREDVIAYRTADQVTWTELPVTGDGAGTNVFSAAASALWRFGCLTFTEDGKGLVFWGGFSSYAAASTTSSYQISHHLAGTLYGTDISTAGGITSLTVTSLLNTADGGSSSGVAAFTTASPYNPALPSLAYSGTAGVIKPYGGFLSRNRRFLYIVNKGAIVAAGNEYPLVGVNIRSTNTAQNINGRTDLRGFAVGGWPARRGFVAGTYNYYAQYGLSLTDYPCYRKHGMGLQIMPRGTGWVLFASQYQASGPAAGTASSSYGGPINTTFSYDYASYGGQVEGFNADVGGSVVRLSNFSGDTSIRRMHFLEPVDGGDRLAFVFDTFGTNNGSVHLEQLHAITGFALNDVTGAQVGTTVNLPIEATGTRISDAFAFGSTRDRLYYAAGSTNENTKVLKEATLGASSVTVRTLSATAGRYNILHVAR